MSIFQEYDIISGPNEGRKHNASRSRTSSKSADSTTSQQQNQQQQQQSQQQSDGITQIQIGLFELLRDFILILPDSSIQEVLAHYVTIDVVLVMANNPDSGVRTAIVRLLTNMCQRLSETTRQMYRKCLYWHHLGNQMALAPIDQSLLQVCCQWVTGSCLTIDQIVSATLKSS